MDSGSTILGLWDKWGFLGIAVAAFLALWGLWHKHNKNIFYAPVIESDEERRLRENDLKVRLAWIEKRYFDSVYLNLLGWMLDWVAKRLTKDAMLLNQSDRQGGWTGKLFGLNPFTEASYLLCLRLAFIYPALSFFVVWLVGGPGEFSGLVLLQENATSGLRLFTLASCLVITWAYWRAINSEDRSQFLEVAVIGVSAGALALVVAGAGAGAGAGTGIGAVAGALALALAVAGAGSLALTFALAGAFAVTFVGVFAGAFAFADALAITFALAIAFPVFLLGKKLASPKAKAAYWISIYLFYVTAITLILAWTTSQTPNTDQTPIPEVFLVGVFLVVLPLVNAVVDWMSLGFTRGLLYAIHRRNHTGLMALGWAVLDIVLALFFLFTIITLSVLVLAGINAATYTWSGAMLMDLDLLFNGLSLEPTALEYGWLHFMMLTTLIPTFIHFTVAGAAAVLAVPNPIRDFIQSQWDMRGDARTVGLWYVSVAPVLGLLAPALLLWGLYALVSSHGGMIGSWMLSWARGIAALIDPLGAIP